MFLDLINNDRKEARTANIHPSRRNTPKKKPMNQPNDHGVFCLLGVRRQPASVQLVKS
jgi:hypothetical protein